MYGLTVLFSLHPGHGEAFDRLVAETLPDIKSHEPGTLVYAVHEVHDQPEARVFYELYRDRAAFEEHERQEHVRRFLAERRQHLADVRVEFLTLSDGKGVPTGEPT
jgi:quinol monooxygenase YgiN